MKIPFLNLTIQNSQIEEEAFATIKEIVSKNQFINGPAVAEFEANFAAYCGMPYAVGVGNGTDALVLAMRAMGVKRGDHVITVPNTFIATTEAIAMVGGRTVFVDVDPDTFLMDPARLEQKIEGLLSEGTKVKAIIPVHLFGLMCEMERIKEIADRYGIGIVEDSAQAHGARYRGNPPGYYSDIATFSFYPGKNLGAYGDAGAVVTKNRALYQWIKMAKDHGRSDKYLHRFESGNFRIDTIQAAILNIKLRYLESWTGKRIENAKRYEEIFRETDILTPYCPSHRRHVYHIYAVRFPERDRLREHLSGRGISTGIHYPVPLHLQPACSYLGYRKGDFPNAEKLADTVLSIPIDDRTIERNDLTPFLKRQS